MKAVKEGVKANPDGTDHGSGSWFAIADSKNRGARATKNQGGSWFNVAHNTTSGKGQNPVHRQISGPSPMRRASHGSSARPADR